MTTPTGQDEREPKQCPRCMQWCVYDGWDHVHGTGLGIGSCAVAGADTGSGTVPSVDPPRPRGHKPWAG